MTLDLDAIKKRCEVLDERMAEGPWALEGPNHYGLFRVYDSDGNAISHGIEEQQAFIAHSRADVPALVAEVERLRRELHDEQVRRDEWEKMYNQAIAESALNTGPCRDEPAPDALPCGHPRSAATGDITQWCTMCEEEAG